MLRPSGSPEGPIKKKETIMVEYILAGGQQRPFAFTYKAIKRFCQETNTKLNEMELSLSDFSQIEKMLFIGFVTGCEKDEKKVDFEETDIEDWIDVDFGLIEACTTVIAEQMGTNSAKKNPKSTKVVDKN